MLFRAAMVLIGYDINCFQRDQLMASISKAAQKLVLAFQQKVEISDIRTVVDKGWIRKKRN